MSVLLPATLIHSAAEVFALPPLQPIPALSDPHSRIAPSHHKNKSGKLRRNKVRKGTFRILTDFSLMDYLKKRKNGTLTVFIHLYKHI